jgi:hypothetical protein
MGKVLLATVAMTSVFVLTSLNASAAPSEGFVGINAMPAHATVTNVDYYWDHHHYHHRRWDHHHWHYWD